MPDIWVRILASTTAVNQPSPASNNELATIRRHICNAFNLHKSAHEDVHHGVPLQLTSLIVRDAEVCCRKILHRPTLYLLSMPSSCLVTCADGGYVASLHS